ncbi:hypothetical protein [Fulvitalea axinellae]
MLERLKRRRRKPQQQKEEEGVALGKMPPAIPIAAEEDWLDVGDSESLKTWVGQSKAPTGLRRHLKRFWSEEEKRGEVFAKYYPVNEPNDPEYMPKYLGVVEQEFKDFKLLKAAIPDDEVFEEAKTAMETLLRESKAHFASNVDVHSTPQPDKAETYAIIREFVQAKAKDLEGISFAQPYLEAITHMTFNCGYIEQIKNHLLRIVAQCREKAGFDKLDENE